MNAVVFACLVVLLCLDAVTVECVTLKSTFSSSNKTMSRHHSKRGTSGSRLTYEERLDFLKAHNEYRRIVKPPASDMQFMVWHEELASMAQEWADRCQFEHGQVKRDPPPFAAIGQNLYAQTGDKPSGQLVTKSWQSEVAGYNYTSNTCTKTPCGHYTQVVWAKSNNLGCAISHCAKLNDTHPLINAAFVVCNYGPPGNVNRRRPYTEGKACSACPQGTSCDAGLCAPSPKCGTKACHNGGTLDPESCECQCTPPHNGAMCDTGGKSNANKCANKICHNGGTLDSASCECRCTPPYNGTTCENNINQIDGGHVITPVNWLQGVTCVLTLNTIIKVY